MKNNQINKIEVHFSNLARGGKVRILLGNASGVQLGVGLHLRGNWESFSDSAKKVSM